MSTPTINLHYKPWVMGKLGLNHWCLSSHFTRQMRKMGVGNAEAAVIAHVPERQIDRILNPLKETFRIPGRYEMKRMTRSGYYGKKVLNSISRGVIGMNFSRVSNPSHVESAAFSGGKLVAGGGLIEKRMEGRGRGIVTGGKGVGNVQGVGDPIGRMMQSAPQQPAPEMPVMQQQSVQPPMERERAHSEPVAEI